jgi:hypothetical protein
MQDLVTDGSESGTLGTGSGSTTDGFDFDGFVVGISRKDATECFSEQINAA